MTAFPRAMVWVFAVCIASSVIAAGAGALGMATTVGVLGLAAAPFIARPAWRAVRAAPLVPALAAAAIAWFALSHIWSASTRPDEVYKLLLLAPVYVMAAYACWRADDAMAARLAPWIAGGTGLLALWFSMEALLGMPVSIQSKDWFHDVTAYEEARSIAMRRLSRGATHFLMLAAPAALWLWMRGGRFSRAGALGLLAASVIAASAFAVAANVVALTLALCVMAAALKWPRLTLQGALIATAVFILASPVIMGALLALIPDSLAERLPLTWHWRMEIWAFALERIAERPVTGHGLDSGRVMSDLVMLRGMEIERMPIHAHNAGLHIWMETGLIGAVLAAAALLGLARAAGRAALTALQCAAIASAFTVMTVSVMLGYGPWQEWNQAALALSAGAAFLLLRQKA
ncbi:hypothetical protein F1654_07405 [Alkalicaulis satelles]|uniref:O-antigen ligase-related domain-containing protein n=1 Tax=Alkalicaulis satelles TaxID=2609175 RepID=A0A5M6ZH29_9PROT|nr:O-antigen ligase family protein [Alkalicaulis satelles]KAA5803620.1 hypothetical protein F1654_07405 [Alkalicaulis satelles]